MKLIIQQSNITEQVSSQLVDKLYTLASTNALTNDSNLQGSITASILYDDAIQYLRTKFSNLIISATDYYIRFADANILNALLANNYGDGTGITISELAAKSSPASIVKATNATKFNEFRYWTSVTGLPSNAFYQWSTITEITLPSTLTSLGTNAFAGCTSLKKINLNNVTRIGHNAFCGDSNLEQFTLEGNQGELNLPNLTSWNSGNNQFIGTKVTAVLSLGSVTTIPAGCFKNCTNLSSITFPQNLSAVDAEALDGTAWYDNQPDGTVIINNTILYKYKGSITGTYTVPSNITYISGSCFKDKNGLTGVVWPNSLYIIPNACFQNSGLTSFDLTGIVTIESNAFRNSKLTSIVIPNSVTTLRDNCFYQCPDLTSITIGTGVISLGRNIFSMCSSLETLVIPSNVKSLERDTLTDCTSLQWVRLESTTMVSLNNASCFNNTNNCIIYVPSDLVDTYKGDSKWSSLASRIQAIPT